MKCVDQKLNWETKISHLNSMLTSVIYAIEIIKYNSNQNIPKTVHNTFSQHNLIWPQIVVMSLYCKRKLYGYYLIYCLDNPVERYLKYLTYTGFRY